MKISIEPWSQNVPSQRLAEIRVVINDRRWVRFVAVYGEPPGSHIGLWRTRYGNLRGINLRIGKRYIKAFTLFVHTSVYEKLAA